MALPAEARQDCAQLGTAEAAEPQSAVEQVEPDPPPAPAVVVGDVVIGPVPPPPEHEPPAETQLQTAFTLDMTGAYSETGQAVSTHGVAAAPIAEDLEH